MLRFQYFCAAAIAALFFATSPLPGWAQDHSDAQDAAQQAVQDTAQQDTAQQDTAKNKNSEDKASDKPAPKPKKPFGGGTPIDVIIHNKFWETPPEPKEFVKENRRPLDELHYQPTVGTEPERPKTRSKDELKALQSELEQAETHNTDVAKGKRPAKTHRAAHKAKTADKAKPAAASSKAE